MTPSTHPGLLGICLSGAGPTILAFVNKNFDAAATPAAAVISTDASDITLAATAALSRMEEIGEAIKTLWKKEGIDVEWIPLEVDEDGATCVEEA